MAHQSVIKLDILYDRENPEASAIELLYAIRPDWESTPGDVKIEPLLGGVPNTLLKITKLVPDNTELENDRAAIVLRAYGDEPKVLVDRDLEAKIHEMLAERNLASTLFARFSNGLLYAYLPGRVCQIQDLVQEGTWNSVAAKLGEYHAKMHITDNSIGDSVIKFSRPIPNIWSSMQLWISALPSQTTEETERRDELQNELSWCFSELSNRQSTIEDSYVLGHCDLLCGNIIIATDDKLEPDRPNDLGNIEQMSPNRIRFIDYEFAMLCPAAFDIANHFSEWGGFDCDYSMVPGRLVRRKFIERYLWSYMHYAGVQMADLSSAASRLADEVDLFRGIPGLWWAIHGFVSVLQSKVDFDWIPYSNKRLAEYWGWKAELDGSRFRRGEKMTLRERMWAQE